MTRSPKPPPLQRLVGSRIARVLVGALLLLLLVSFGRELFRRYEVHQDVSKLQAQIDSLQQRKSDLSGLIDLLQNSLFQEQEARAKLGLSKSGETTVIVPLSKEAPAQTDDTEQVAVDAERTAAPEDRRRAPIKWWEYYFGTP